MSVINAIISFILSIFGKKPKIIDTTNVTKYHNDEDALSGGLEGESSKTEEEQESQYGIWAFLKRIIDLVEQKFSQPDKEEVKQIGRTMNEIGAKFLGEIKVGKSPRSMTANQALQTSKGKQQSL